jgi:membrane glycosyltransferase
MHWQDIVITCGQIIFIIALVPAIKHAHKPPFSTSILNTIVLISFAFVYVTLSLWFAAVTTAVVGILWFILAMQKKGKFLRN